MPVGEAGFVDVGDVELGLGGDEEEVAGVGLFFVGEVDGAGGLAGFEGCLEFGEGGELGLDLVVGGGGLVELFDFGVALFDGVEVGEEEFGVDDVDVVEGVDAAGDVDDLGVVEAADDVAGWRRWRGCGRGTGCRGLRPWRRLRRGRRCR